MSVRAGKRILKSAALVAAVGLLLWWFIHPRRTDEELILDLVAKAEHGIETKDRREIMDCVAEDYHDEAGLSRIDILRLAIHWERSSEQVEIAVEEYELDVEAPRATGRFVAELEFEQAGRYDPPLRLPLVVEFEKQRRRWRRVWVVKSVSGHGLEKGFEGLY